MFTTASSVQRILIVLFPWRENWRSSGFSMNLVRLCVFPCKTDCCGLKTSFFSGLYIATGLSHFISLTSNTGWHVTLVTLSQSKGDNRFLYPYTCPLFFFFPLFSICINLTMYCDFIFYFFFYAFLFNLFFFNPYKFLIISKFLSFLLNWWGWKYLECYLEKVM